uniref:hypothetical protein n=1 Tax=Yoonia sp. TaxID=2212373 RepID=UPI0040474EBB
MTDTNDICITIDGASYPILCGFCQEKIAFIGEPEADTCDAGCAACENTADVQEVAAVAIDYATHEAQLALNRLAKETASKSSFMTFKGETVNDKRHRFIV